VNNRRCKTDCFANFETFSVIFHISSIACFVPSFMSPKLNLSLRFSFEFNSLTQRALDTAINDDDNDDNDDDDYSFFSQRGYLLLA